MANIFEKIGNDFKSNFVSSITSKIPKNLDDLKSLAPANSNPFQEDPIVEFGKSNSSYSGIDCTCMLQLNDKIIILGNVHTFSFSTSAEKFPVRTLGRRFPRHFTSGPVSIAGSIIFVVFDKSPLYEAVTQVNYIRNPNDRRTSPTPDMLPPLDLTLLCHNEYGFSSVLRLYGVEFINQGQVHSISDLYTENTMQYVARDIDELVSEQDIQGFRDMLFERQARGLFVDNYLASLLDYQNDLKRQLEETNNIILQIDTELGRRAVGGVFTLGVAQALNTFVSNTMSDRPAVTRLDLYNEKEKQLKIKDYLIKELENTNRLISQHEQNIRGGYNSVQSGQGTSGLQNGKQQVST